MTTDVLDVWLRILMGHTIIVQTGVSPWACYWDQEPLDSIEPAVVRSLIEQFEVDRYDRSANGFRVRMVGGGE